MKKTLVVVATLALTALMAAGCMSHKMMMSDHTMMSSDGTMTMMNSDGTSRAITDQEMHDHMAMLMNDSRFASTVANRCKNMGSVSSKPSISGGSSQSVDSSNPGGEMKVMNADGTSHTMTDDEYRSQVNMMMKNTQMSQMIMSRCNGM